MLGGGVGSYPYMLSGMFCKVLAFLYTFCTRKANIPSNLLNAHPHQEWQKYSNKVSIYPKHYVFGGWRNRVRTTVNFFSWVRLTCSADSLFLFVLVTIITETENDGKSKMLELPEDHGEGNSFNGDLCFSDSCLKKEFHSLFRKFLPTFC